MKRLREPNMSLWVAPGGPIASHESPNEAAARSLLQDTGLHPAAVQLRGVVTLEMPRSPLPSVHFLYVVSQFTGRLKGDDSNGILHWWPVDETWQLPMPQANACYLPHILDPSTGLYQARYTYDADAYLVAVTLQQDDLIPAGIRL